MAKKRESLISLLFSGGGGSGGSILEMGDSSSWSRAMVQISPYTYVTIGIAISIGVSVNWDRHLHRRFRARGGLVTTATALLWTFSGTLKEKGSIFFVLF